MARPELYHDETEFIIHTTGDSRLHANSDRRAIVDLIVENGGRMKLGAIDEHFGYSVRDRVLALKRCGWLALAPEPEPPVKKPPERPAKKKKSKKQTGAKKR
jgi:hypothetical protein